MLSTLSTGLNPPDSNSILPKQSSWCSVADYTLCSPKSLWLAVKLLKSPPRNNLEQLCVRTCLGVHIYTTLVPRPGNNWACSTNISTILPLPDYCACLWDPHQTTYINTLEATQTFAAKLATGLWSPGCQDPIQLMNWPPLEHTEKDKSCCLVDQSYHPQYSLLTPPQAPSPYGIVIILVQNFCPSSLFLPKCYCNTCMEQNVI